ncbi:MAG: class I SAM-dependent methyltransferase [Verrucomicrobiota bacterium]|nr:class I SAM-dependent methyltransferase [Verrucomicrobiota bacterium]
MEDAAFPFADESFDVVLFSEVLEHVQADSGESAAGNQACPEAQRFAHSDDTERRSAAASGGSESRDVGRAAVAFRPTQSCRGHMSTRS